VLEVMDSSCERAEANQNSDLSMMTDQARASQSQNMQAFVETTSQASVLFASFLLPSIDWSKEEAVDWRSS
jgi:hypothetical protein